MWFWLQRSIWGVVRWRSHRLMAMMELDITLRANSMFRFVTLFFIALASTSSVNVARADGDVELAMLMADLQYFTHKTALSIDAKNQSLAGFYLHEMEEVLEEIEDVEEYDDYPIGALTKSMLMPVFEQLEDLVKAGDMVKASAKFDAVVGACNQCHQSSGHGFIVIERRMDNPYMQRFSGE